MAVRAHLWRFLQYASSFLLYRVQANRARRLAREQTHHEAKALLQSVAQDYDDIAEDLENGAVEIRHPEMLPQRDR